MQGNRLAAVIDLVNDVRTQLLGSSTQLKALLQELEILHETVKSLEDNQYRADLDDLQQEELDSVLGQIAQILAGLQSKLSGPEDIKTSGQFFNSIGKQIQAQAARLQSLSGKRSSLPYESHESHTSDASASDALKWLSSIDHAAKHNSVLQSHCDGTGAPFLESDEVQTWLNGAAQTLLCTGIPGAGKSVLASQIIDRLYRTSGTDENIGIAYVYCDYRQRHEQSTGEVLGSLIKQLALRRRVLPDVIETLQESQRSTGSVSLVDLSTALSTISSSFSKIFIVIDGLDEKQRSDASHKRIISDILQLQSSYKVSLLVTSRPIPDVTGLFKDTPSVAIKAGPGDVKRYISNLIKLFPPFVQQDKQLQEDIREKIAGSANGIFSVAVHYASLLMAQTSQQSLHTALDSLPSRATAYGSFLDTTLERIEDQSLERKALAEKVISLVICAKRRLYPRELQHAMSVEVDQLDLDMENPPRTDEMLSSCLGVLIICPHTGYVQFVHPIMEQYFVRTWKDRMSRAQDTLASVCITYLSLPAFSVGPCANDEAYEQRLVEYPFFEYAAQFWGVHARHKQYWWFSSQATEESGREVGLDLLADPTKVAVCSQGLLTRKGDPGYSQRYPSMTGLHLAAYFGITYLIPLLTDQGQNPRSKDSNGHTPLWWALEQRQRAMVDALKIKDSVTMRLLIKEQRQDLITYLMSCGYDINTSDFWNRTPLYTVISSGDHQLLTDFLGYRADVNIRDREGITPLRLAVQLRRLDLAALLLKHGASPEDISLGEWRRLHRLRLSDVMMASSHGNKGVTIDSCSLATTEKILQWAHAAGPKFHLILWGNSKLWGELTNTPTRDLVPFVLKTDATRDDERKRFQYSVSVHLPYRYDHLSARHDSDKIGVAWTVRWQDEGEETEGWQSTDFSSTLPYVWVPESGVDLLLRFLGHLKRKWLDLCEFEMNWLNDCRRQVFLVKGEDGGILDRLLRDAEWWTELRSILQRQVRDAKAFGDWYCSLHDGEYSATKLTEAADALLQEVSHQIDLLDRTSKDLIQIEFNLVSINEARLSTSTALSMKRLSWISFIFLPATFASTLFGMNVNILENNPDWRWYLPFVASSLILSIIGWLVFKYNPTMETWFDRKTESIFSSIGLASKTKSR